MAAVRPTKATIKRMRAPKLSHEIQPAIATASFPSNERTAARTERIKTASAPKTVSPATKFLLTGNSERTAVDAGMMRTRKSSMYT